MIRSLKELGDYQVYGKDGLIGNVEEFYFDDFDWRIRYVVIDGGEWLEGRRLLISILACGNPRDNERVLPVDLRKEIVKNSPDVTPDRPITRQEEIALHSYYKWPFYWEGVGISAYPLVEMAAEMRQKEADQGQVTPHLHSAESVYGLNIQSRDGSIGSVADFIIEDEAWNMLYLVIDTGNWLPGKKVIISPQWIKEIRWKESQVVVDLSRETIKNSPEYDPAVPLEREYEDRLYDHYGREKYWRDKET